MIHERGGRFAIIFVISATTFSLSAQAHVLGVSVADVASALRTSPGLLLVALLPHALPELTALFLPLAAWILASRRGEWDQLLAATVVTVGLAVPVLVMTAGREVSCSTCAPVRWSGFSVARCGIPRGLGASRRCPGSRPAPRGTAGAILILLLVGAGGALPTTGAAGRHRLVVP